MTSEDFSRQVFIRFTLVFEHRCWRKGLEGCRRANATFLRTQEDRAKHIFKRISELGQGGHSPFVQPVHIPAVRH